MLNTGRGECSNFQWVAPRWGFFIQAMYGWLSKLWSFLGTLNIRCRIMIGIRKGTIIWTTAHMFRKVLFSALVPQTCITPSLNSGVIKGRYAKFLILKGSRGILRFGDVTFTILNPRTLYSAVLPLSVFRLILYPIMPSNP